MIENPNEQTDHLIGMTPNLGKREIIRRANDQAQRHQKRINNQKAAIERLLLRWDLLKVFVQSANDELESATCIALSQGILDEMARLEDAETLTADD